MRASIKAALASSVMLIATASLAQTAPPASAGPETPADICGLLVAFLQDQGGRVQGVQTPITLDEARRYAREDNRFACRSAIYSMYTANVPLPAPMLDAVGAPVDRAGRPASPPR